MDYSKAEGSTRDFAKTIAKLELDLAKLHKAAARGFQAPELQGVTKLFGELKQSVVLNKELSESQTKQLDLVQRYASIESKNVQAQELINREIQKQVKIREDLHTVQSRMEAKERALTAQRLKKEQQELARKQLAEKRSLEMTYAKIPALQAEAAQMQRTLRHHGLESTELGKQITLLRQKANVLETNRAAGKNITGEVKLQTLELEKQLKVAKSQMETIVADMPGTGGKSETFWERRFGWFVAGSVFYGTMRAAKDMVENAKSIESSMTLIRRLTNDTTADFGVMQKALLDLGVQYGQTWDVVSDVAERWARAGYSVRDILNLTETALVTLNTAELNAVEATESMIAIMSQWGMSSTDLLPTLDKITKAADNYAVSSADLIQGLSRASGAAKSWNMTLEDTIAFLTVLRESTGRTGREIGNVLNTLLAFMKRPETIRAFESVGLDIYADQAHSRYRNIMAIFGDLSQKMPSMTAEGTQALVNAAEAAGLFTEEVAEAADAVDLLTLAQQQNVSTAAAGTRRQNYLIAVLNNWARVDSVLLDLEDALGYSLQSNAKTMETYEAKIRQFQAAWEQMATTFMEAGLIELMKRFTDTGRGMISFLNDLPRPIQAAIGALSLYAATLAAVNLATKTFGAGSALDVLGKIGLASLGTPQLLMFGGGLAVGAGILAAIKHQQEYNRQLGLMGDAYAEVTEKLSKLEKGTDDYNAALEAQQSILNAIGDKYPQIVTSIDEFGNVTGVATDRLEKFSQEMSDAKSPTEDLREEIDALNEKLSDMQENWGKTADVFEKRSFLGIPFGLHRDSLAIAIENEMRREDERNLEEFRERKRSLEAELAKRSETTGASETSDKVAFDLANWRKQFLMLEDPSIEMALTNVRRDLKLLAIEEDNLAEAMMSEAKAKEFAAEKSRLLARENELLSATNGQLYAKVALYRDAQAEANRVLANPSDEDARRNAIQAYNEAASQISSLTSKIADNTIKMRENEIAITQAGNSVVEYFKKIGEAQKKTLDDMFSTRKTFFQHEVDLGRANRDIQIRFWRDMLETYRHDANKRMEIEKKLHALYKSGLEEQMKLAEKAYSERIKQIEDEADARIRSIQKQIDALDEEQQDTEREEAARQHAEKIKDIEEQIHYHSLRVGREHEEAIVDLQKQKTEEQIRWELQQDKWAREDRKDVLNKRIADIEEYANKQKEELLTAWEEAKTIFAEEANTLIATASIYDEMWYEKGLDWISQVAEGMSSGMGRIRDILDHVSASTGKSSSSDVKGRSQALLEAKRAWEKAHEVGDVEGMRRAEEAAAAIRSSGPTLDPSNELTGDELEDKIRRATFHTGGTNLKTGWAYLAEQEHVLTASLSTKLGEFLDRWEHGVTTSVTYNIDKMVSINNAQFEDRADMQALASIISRRIEVLNTSRGR